VEDFGVAMHGEPRRQVADGCFIGRVAVGQDAVVDHDGHAAGTRKAQKFAEHTAEVVDKVGAFGEATEHLDHDAAHVEAELQFGAVFAAFDAQCQDLAQLLAGRALFDRHRARRGVVACDQAPQLAPHDQGDRHRGQRAHIAHVLQVHGRDAAQRGERQVVARAAGRILGRDERLGLVIGVLDHADWRQRVQLARLRRDVAGRECLAQVGLVVGRFGLGHHAAMAARVEPVHHHAAVARDRAHMARGQIGQRGDGGVLADLGEKVGDERVQMAKIRRLGALDGFEFSDHQAIPDVAEHIEMAAIVERDGTEIHRALAERIAGQFARHALATGLADDGSHWQAECCFRCQARQREQVGAGLQHVECRRERQHEAVWLDTSWRANRFAGAAGNVELVGGCLGHGPLG